MVKNFDEVQQFGKEQRRGDDEVVRCALQERPGDRRRGRPTIPRRPSRTAPRPPRSSWRQVRSTRRSRCRADYFKKTYEGFVSQATKVTELYADLAKETYKPFESLCRQRAGVK